MLFKRRHKKGLKPLVDLGFNIISCKECHKFNVGVEIYNMFDWSNSVKAIGYDKETDEILLAEEQIMRIIQMVNPFQQPRKIKLVSQDDLLKK